MTREEFQALDRRLRHAIQSGVAMEMERGVRSTEPKHLRTGLDAAMADMGGVVQLLIAKGVITEEEYFEASAKALRDEVTRYERRLTEMLGANIKLG